MFDRIMNAMGIEALQWARPVSTTVLLVGVVAIAVWSMLLYRHSRGLRLWQRVLLAMARAVVLAIVLATLLEPMARIRQTRRYPRRLPVLIDTSASMSIRDQRKQPADIIEAAVALGMMPPESVTNANQAVLELTADQRQTIASASRLDLATGLLTGVGREPLASLAEDLDLAVYAFGENPIPVGNGHGMTSGMFETLAPEAEQTAIFRSLEAIATSGPDLATAGIVLLTDGIDNEPGARAHAVLEELGMRGVPVFPVPIGLAAPDDVAIRHTVMQDVAFSGDNVPVRVQIQSRGYEKRTARLVVSLNDRHVAERTVRLNGGLQFEDIAFRMDVYSKGAVRVDVAITPFEDEVSSANNRIVRSVRVVNEKVNVLYIEGSARWEFRYLKAILKRDPRINATFIASRTGPEIARNSQEYLERFPARAEEAFLYDLVILGDVDPAFFRDDELALLEQLVRDRGASLLVLCGAEYTPTAYANTVIEALLPVRFDAELDWKDVSDSVYPVLTPEGVSSMVMTLEDDPEANDRIWSRMAPLDRVPPLLAPKLGATVLAGLSDTGDRATAYPLIAWQRYGTGKCMSIATDRLWRLRFKTGDTYHWRIWSQCIQFMTLSRLMGEHQQVRLETDRAAYPLGEQVRLYAHVLDKDFAPIRQRGFDVDLTGLGEATFAQRIRLRPVQGQSGLYEGYFSPPEAGRYRLESNADDRRFSNTIEFQVARVDLELRETGMRADTLERIATLTGGRMLSMSQLPGIAALLDRAPMTATVVLERPLWDNWLAILLVVGLAGMEWLIRRRHDLP